jgi:hypothetical protein
VFNCGPLPSKVCLRYPRGELLKIKNKTELRHDIMLILTWLTQPVPLSSDPVLCNILFKSILSLS